MMDSHPLYGKETVCHVCSGTAVWVFNGDQVGNYHYCRTCKIETGPFANTTIDPILFKFSEEQIDAQMQIIEQMYFDFGHKFK